MPSRAPIFAAVALLVNCLAGPEARAQAQNLEAGKSPSQLFAGTCNACHKSPRGLLKTVSPGSLPGFLREHYTTGSDMASQLSSYLISNGAGDNRQAKQGAEAKQGAGTDQNDRQGRRPRNAPSEEAARPDADSASQSENGRQGHKRLARPGEGSEEMRRAPDGPPQAIDRGPDGRKMTAKPRRGKPGTEEAPAAIDETPRAEPAMSDQAREQAKDQVKDESGKEDSAAKPGDTRPNEAKPEAARLEGPKDPSGGDKPVARRDPVPPVTPAPPASAAIPSAVGSGPSEVTAAPKAPATAGESPAVTASTPPAPPTAGPPAPPISQ